MTTAPTSRTPSRPGCSWVLAGVLACCAAMPAAGQDRVDLDQTKIVGNRELPKILYIVPWKKAMPGDLSGRPVASVLDEALAPIDREVFRRQVQYDAVLHPPPAVTKPGAK